MDSWLCRCYKGYRPKTSPSQAIFIGGHSPLEQKNSARYWLGAGGIRRRTRLTSMVTSLRLLACLRVTRMRLNISLDTDTQPENAASRRLLRAGQLER